MKIHLWFPGIFDFKGGIQVFSTFFINAIEKILPNADRSVFLKNDRSQNTSVQFDSRTQFYCSGRLASTFLHTPFFSAQVFLSAIVNKPDLIICGHINFSPLAYRISNLLNIPYWIIVHGIDVWNLKNIAKIDGLKHANKIISVSQYTTNRVVEEQGIDPAKIFLLPNTIDINQFQIYPKSINLLDRYKISRDQLVILTVARLSQSEKYKGYDKILEALPKIIEKIPNIHYLLVGKGDDTDRIKDIIKNLGIQSSVTFTGFVSDEELCDYYNICDVFAMPSKKEGFGIVYLEAMACGKPCLGSNQDGAIDALAQGDLGVLVNPDDVDEIANTLIQILQKNYPHPLLYKPEQLRQAVIDRFGFEVFQQRLHQYLEDFFS